MRWASGAARPRTRTLPARVARWCVALGALAAAAGCAVSETEERELGAEEAASVDSQLPLIHDTTIARFVTTLGRSMTTHTERADLAWRFSVVDASVVNAFALPGGYIYVTRGLIERSDSLDELADVMGHEIAHVVRRHSAKQLEQAEKRDIGLVLLCTMTNACRSLGGAIAIQVGADAQAAQYSQHDEAEADSVGLEIALRTGYDPEGLPRFLQKLLDQREYAPTPIEAFFATHPTDEARIASLRRQIARLDRSTMRALTRDTPEFHQIQARLRAMPPPPPVDTGEARPHQ
jgi:predicted Zn-dependent protease